jgi:hypothetical protein
LSALLQKLTGIDMTKQDKLTEMNRDAQKCALFSALPRGQQMAIAKMKQYPMPKAWKTAKRRANT